MTWIDFLPPVACPLTKDAPLEAAFYSTAARGPDTRGLSYWTLQFSLDLGLASGLGASRPRLALRPSRGLSAELRAGRWPAGRDLVPGSAGLRWRAFTCNTSILVRGLDHIHISAAWKIQYFIFSSNFKGCSFLWVAHSFTISSSRRIGPPNRLQGCQTRPLRSHFANSDGQRLAPHAVRHSQTRREALWGQRLCPLCLCIPEPRKCWTTRQRGNPHQPPLALTPCCPWRAVTPVSNSTLLRWKPIYNT